VGAVGPPLVGFDEFEGFIGEVRHGDDAAHGVDEVLRAVKQNGDFIKIADSEAVIESGLPEIEDVVTTFHRSEVPVHAVGHCRPEEVGFIHPVRRFNLRDFGFGLRGHGREDVEDEGSVDVRMILRGAAFAHLDTECGFVVAVLGATTEPQLSKCVL